MNFNDDDDFKDLVNAIPPSDIFAFNELRSCADLKRMHDKKQLDLSPDFQREEVWKYPEKTRFLDSLLKNLPIPSMCISLDMESNKRIVIDGLQRISTIVQFLSASVDKGLDFKLSNLDDIDNRLSGKWVSEIVENYPEIIEAIENVTIPVTVLRCMLSRDDHMEYIFTIFHRLNTGGMKLNSQEIRNCIFNGSLNDLLSRCAKENQDILNHILNTKENKRFSHEEFILRFFAFYDDLDAYQAPLARFLNNYMKRNKNPEQEDIDFKYNLFKETIDLYHKNLISNSKEGKVLGEAILYGIAKNLSNLNSKPSEYFTFAANVINHDLNFSSKELTQGTFKTPTKVKKRFDAAFQAFSG